jgi:hypothetical protein
MMVLDYAALAVAAGQLGGCVYIRLLHDGPMLLKLLFRSTCGVVGI